MSGLVSSCHSRFKHFSQNFWAFRRLFWKLARSGHPSVDDAADKIKHICVHFIKTLQKLLLKRESRFEMTYRENPLSLHISNLKYSASFWRLLVLTLLEQIGFDFKVFLKPKKPRISGFFVQKIGRRIQWKFVGGENGLKCPGDFVLSDSIRWQEKQFLV